MARGKRVKAAARPRDEQTSPRAKESKQKQGVRVTIITKAVGFLPRVLPAAGFSVSAVMWGLDNPRYYLAAAAAVFVTLFLILIRRLSRATVVGLDVGHSAIKVVQISRKANPTLLRYGITPTPPGSVSGGSIQDPEAVAAALRQALGDAGITEREITAVMTGQTLVLQHLEFPESRESELRSTIGDNISQYVPMPPGDISYDYMRLPASEEGSVRVLLVATQREPVTELARTLRAAGTLPARVDIQPLAAYRSAFGAVGTKTGRKARARRVEPQVETEERIPEVQAIVDCGAGTTDVSIYQDGILQLQRVLRVAGDDFSRSIAVTNAVSMEEAESLKREHGLLPDSPISSAVGPVTEKLFREVWLSLEFVHSRNRGVRFKELVLIGGNSKLKGLSEQLKEYLDSSLQGIIDTSELTVRIAAHSGLVAGANQAEMDEVYPVIAVALGLALGEVDGRVRN